MDETMRYAIGQQDFKTLREDDALYIDKTAFVDKIAKSKGKYFFLARPRRFGKSLFLSTLRYFFEGRRELFKGLYIDSSKWDWKPYPVLRLDLNVERYAEPNLLDNVLNNLFKDWEAKYDVADLAEDFPARLHNIIKAAHRKTGRQVVILVDEYDKPLVGNLNKEENFEHYRAKLASIYSNFKSSAEHIRLVFLTGVSRFSKLSVFSDLNNLNDISFDNEYADICGITEKELLDNFQPGISALAKEMESTYDDACLVLKHNYDGYRFARKGSDIYNPWSLMCCLSKLHPANYWSMTGGATVVAESLYNFDVNLEEILNTRCDFQSLVGLDLRNADPLALLYQTGYLTIKDYDRESDTITLGVPNREVKDDLSRVLLPFYIKLRKGSVDGKIRDLLTSIRLGEPEKMMTTLKAFFAGIPYDLKMENENNFQNAIFVLVSLIGANAKAEDRTSDGRIDLTIETPKYVYIIELKYDSSSQAAIDQINEKQYARKYLIDNRKVFKIGANFSSKTRTIENPIIEEV